MADSQFVPDIGLTKKHIIQHGDDAAAAKAADSFSPEEDTRFRDMVNSGADPYHAVNLIHSQRAQDAARASSDDVAGSPLGDSLRAAAVNAGDSATGGGLSTLSALATSMRDLRPDFLRKHTVSFGDGSGSQEPIDAAKEDNANVLADVQAAHPTSSGLGMVAGLLGPMLGGGSAIRATTDAAPAAAGVMKGALQGAAQGGGFGALTGLLNPHAHDADAYGDSALHGAAGGAALGGLFGGLGGVAQAGGFKNAINNAMADASPAPTTPDFTPQADAAAPSGMIGAARDALGVAKHVPGMRMKAGLVDFLLSRIHGAGGAAPAGVGRSPLITDLASAAGDTQPNIAVPSGLDLARPSAGAPPSSPPPGADLYPPAPGLTTQLDALKGAMKMGYGEPSPPTPPSPFQPRPDMLSSPSGIDIGHMGSSPAPSADALDQIASAMHGAADYDPADAAQVSPVPNTDSAPPMKTPPLDLSFLGKPQDDLGAVGGGLRHQVGTIEAGESSDPTSRFSLQPGTSNVPPLEDAAMNAGITPPMASSSSMANDIHALAAGAHDTQAGASPFANTEIRTAQIPAPGVAPVFRGEPTPSPTFPGVRPPERLGGVLADLSPGEGNANAVFHGVPVRRIPASEQPASMAGPDTSNMRIPGTRGAVEPSPSHGALQPGLFDAPAAGDSEETKTGPFWRSPLDTPWQNELDEATAFNPRLRDALRTPEQLNPVNSLKWQDAHDATRAQAMPGMKGALQGKLATHQPPRFGEPSSDPIGRFFFGLGKKQD